MPDLIRDFPGLGNARRKVSRKSASCPGDEYLTEAGCTNISTQTHIYVCVCVRLLYITKGSHLICLTLLEYGLRAQPDAVSGGEDNEKCFRPHRYLG